MTGACRVASSCASKHHSPCPCFFSEPAMSSVHRKKDSMLPDSCEVVYCKSTFPVCPCQPSSRCPSSVYATNAACGSSFAFTSPDTESSRAATLPPLQRLVVCPLALSPADEPALTSSGSHNQQPYTNYVGASATGEGFSGEKHLVVQADNAAGSNRSPYACRRTVASTSASHSFTSQHSVTVARKKLLAQLHEEVAEVLESDSLLDGYEDVAFEGCCSQSLTLSFPNPPVLLLSSCSAKKGSPSGWSEESQCSEPCASADASEQTMSCSFTALTVSVGDSYIQHNASHVKHILAEEPSPSMPSSCDKFGGSEKTAPRDATIHHASSTMYLTECSTSTLSVFGSEPGQSGTSAATTSGGWEEEEEEHETEPYSVLMDNRDNTEDMTTSTEAESVLVDPAKLQAVKKLPTFESDDDDEQSLPPHIDPATRVDCSKVTNVSDGLFSLVLPDSSEELLLLSRSLVGKWETMLSRSDPMEPLFKRFGISYFKRAIFDKLAVPLTITLLERSTLHVLIHLPIGNRQMRWALDGSTTSEDDPDCGTWEGAVKCVQVSLDGRPSCRALQQVRSHRKIGVVHEVRAVLPDEEFGRLLFLKYTLFPKGQADAAIEVVRILKPIK